jgi:hypothetical protein
MPPKRTRKAAEADASKTSMEDAAVALAGVEGALKTTTTTTTGKRKASGTAAAGKQPAKKTVKKRDRSNSMEQLTEVAASLLADPTDEVGTNPPDSERNQPPNPKQQLKKKQPKKMEGKRHKFNTIQMYP